MFRIERFQVIYKVSIISNLKAENQKLRCLPTNLHGVKIHTTVWKKPILWKSCIQDKTPMQIFRENSSEWHGLEIYLCVRLFYVQVRSLRVWAIIIHKTFKSEHYSLQLTCSKSGIKGYHVSSFGIHHFYKRSNIALPRQWLSLCLSPQSLNYWQKKKTDRV